MKARTLALFSVIAGGVMLAQTAPPSQQVSAGTKPAKPAATQAKPAAAQAKPAAAKPAAGAPAKPAAQKPGVAPAAPQKPAGTAAKTAQPVAKTAASPMKPKPAAKPTAAAKRVKVPVHPAKVAEKPAAAAVKPAAIKVPASFSGSRRDPFTSPIREAGVSGPACSTGKKCLAINAIVLRGIVKSQNGMIAVVESAGRRISYFLRENDPVFNGYVVRITGDSVVFRENVMDRLGQQSTRDVVMKVVAPAV